MNRLVEQLRQLERDAPRGVGSLIAVVHSVIGNHPVALVTHDASEADESPEPTWRLRAIFDEHRETVDAAGDLFAINESAARLHPALAAACAASFGSVRIAAPEQAGLGSSFDRDASLLLVPLIRDDRPWAALLLPGSAIEGQGESELQRLWLAVNLAATTLGRRRAAEQLTRVEAQRQREMNEVARIQNRLLPDAQHAIRGAEIAASLDPCEVAGGDYYDYMPLTHHFRDATTASVDTFGVIIADVTGHGAAAAVEAAMFDAILRTYPDVGGPGEVMTYANRHFFSRKGRSHLITAFSAVVDLEMGTLVYTNAGHPPALLKRGDGAVEWLDDSDGIPIGVLPDFEWHGATCRFEPDDLLVLYTDGVIEAASESGEHFGEERLLQTVQQGPSGAGELLSAIREAVAKHRGAAPPRDDTTLVVVRNCSRG